MNLLRSQWLPLRGGHAITPHQVSDASLAFGDLAWPRADFDGATLEFLVGILQVMFPPETHKEWVRLYESPPTESELRSAFQPFEAAFELLGDGPRFMQDPTVAALDPADPTYLLIEYPGENASKLNSDLFVHANVGGVLSLPVAAMGLFALQTYAPSGGVGYRTGVRGGGPLTTMLFADEPRGKNEYGLWRSLWLNVLPLDQLDPQVDRPEGPTADIFPWMAAQRASNPKTGGVETRPGMIHPFQRFWGMPRRLWLHASAESVASCLVTGETPGTVVTGVSTFNYGINYVDFDHPLSPHRRDEKRDVPISIKGKSSADYRDWLAWAVGTGRTGKKVTPADAITAFESADRKRGRRTVINHIHTDRRTIRAIAFGYEMDNAKACAYYRSEVPVLNYPGAQDMGRVLKGHVDGILNGADYAVSVLREAMKAALYDGKRTSGDDGWVAGELMSRTEPAFRQLLENIATAGETGANQTGDALQQFGAELQLATKRVFDERTEALSPEQADMEKLVRARRKLYGVLYSARFWSTLGVENPDSVATTNEK